MKKIFGLEKNVFFLGIVSFFNDFSSEMIVSIFPAFFQSVLRAGAASLGLIEGVADALANLTKVVSGRLSDRIEHRKLLTVLGYSISVATRPFYLIVGNVLGVFGIRAVDRFGKGVREAPRDALLSLSSDRENLGRSFGYHRSMDTLGAILGPLTAFLILRTLPGNFNAVFITAFLVGTLSIVSFVFVKDIANAVKNGRGTLLGLRHYPPVFKRFLLIIFLLSLGNLPVALLLLRTLDLGLDVSLVPLFYLFYNVTFTLLSFAAGRLADRLGDKNVIIGGYALLTVSYLVFAVAGNLGTLAIAFIILGAFSAATEGVQRSYIARLTEKDVRGGAYGFLNASLGFGALFAGLIGGLLWQFAGPPTALLTSVFVTVIGLALLIRNNHLGSDNEKTARVV